MKKFQILVMALLFFLNVENSARGNEFGDLDVRSAHARSALASYGSAMLEEDFFEGWEEETENESTMEKSVENGKIYMKLDLLDHDILKLSILADSIQIPVIGLAFHLKYEQEKLYFLKYEPGEFLEDGGDPFYMVQNDSEKGKIIFGETLRRDDRFPVGGKEIVNFYFQTNEKNLWDNEIIKFEFERPVISSIDTVRQDIMQMNWENLHADRNGVNHWMQNNISNLKTSEFKTESFWSDQKMLGWLIGAVITFILTKKILLQKWMKNQDRKRQTTYVNFK